jgi:hypothetical protein
MFWYERWDFNKKKWLVEGFAVGKQLVRDNYLVGGLEHEFYLSIQLWMSSSHLTNSFIFQRGWSTTRWVFTKEMSNACSKEESPRWWIHSFHPFINKFYIPFIDVWYIIGVYLNITIIFTWFYITFIDVEKLIPDPELQDPMQRPGLWRGEETSLSSGDFDDIMGNSLAVLPEGTWRINSSWFFHATIKSDNCI